MLLLLKKNGITSFVVPKIPLDTSSILWAICIIILLCGKYVQIFSKSNNIIITSTFSVLVFSCGAVIDCIYEWNQDQARINGGKLVSPGFTYSSDNNKDWMSVSNLSNWVENNRHLIGKE